MDESSVTSLEGSISPLRSKFDRAAGTPRFVALVAPTCGPCLRGATAVREEVVGPFQEAGIPVSLVWIPILPGDSPAAIERAAAGFDRDGMQQFADPERRVGRLVADSLGGSDSIAWDTYLFYGPDVRWTDELPAPTEWIDQLDDRSWAPPERYRCGDDLAAELATLADRTIHRSGGGDRS